MATGAAKKQKPQVTKRPNNTKATGPLGVREPADHGQYPQGAVARVPDASVKPVMGGSNGIQGHATHAGMLRMGADSMLGTATLGMAKTIRGNPHIPTRAGMMKTDSSANIKSHKGQAS